MRAQTLAVTVALATAALLSSAAPATAEDQSPSSSITAHVDAYFSGVGSYGADFFSDGYGEDAEPCDAE
ncbi:hypothetical protein [Streptomyces erythrochromogenes]|uniref:hypothetical protein n=1 Tax=Streptomyces erythrochromogenes TaxID=285574 RepID=UPI0037F6B40C